MNYIEKQKKYYQLITAGYNSSALDVLWDAAKSANLLLENETICYRLTPDRKRELLKQLGWTQKPILNACKFCQGTGRDPMSDIVNWFPCSHCHGTGGQ